MIARRLITALLMPLILGGCLLPQPDTPPIGPRLAAPTTLKPTKGTGVTPILPQPDTPPISKAAPTVSEPQNSAGGLLPQPDTPPIGSAVEVGQGAMVAAPAIGTVSPAAPAATRDSIASATITPEATAGATTSDSGSSGTALPSVTPTPSPAINP